LPGNTAEVDEPLESQEPLPEEVIKGSEQEGLAKPARPRHRGPSPWRRGNVVIGTLVIVQVAAVVVFGTIAIARYPLWSVVDEGAHYDNVIWIATHGSLPVLGKAPASEQQLAIRQGLYPRRSTIVPAKYGLGGLSYEAFQPPLYYVVASPVSLLSSNYRTKAYLLRFFGLALLLLAIALYARLSRHVLKKRWLYGLSAGLLIFMMPGIIIRSVTISNVNLAIPIFIAAVTEMWIAWERRSPRRLVVAGGLVGLSVLTDLYLAELVPVLIILGIDLVRTRRTWIDAAWALAAGVVAFVIVLPWLIFNEIHFHALTASTLVKAEQDYLVNPHHLHDSIGQLPNLTVNSLLAPLMPQEWATYLPSHPGWSELATVFQVLLIPGVIVLVGVLGRRLLSSGLWLLALPWVFNILLCWYIDIAQMPDTLIARYTYPSLTLLGLLGAAGLLQLTRSVRPLVVISALGSFFLIALWISAVPLIATT
jgi:Dolichyl-phosphate-mannose-protein mannosyltransferase